MNTIIEKKKAGRKASINNLCPWCGSTMRSCRNTVVSKKATYTLKEFVDNFSQPEKIIKQPEIRTKYRYCKNSECGYVDYVRVSEDKVEILNVKQPSKLYKIMEDFMNNTEPINDNELNDILEKLRNS